MNTDEIVRAAAAAKSLRWLANMFPDAAGEDEASKLSRCIHLYCTAGADSIDALAAQLEASQCKEQAAVCNERVINRGMDVTGEYDIDADLLCPACGAVVGDSEYQELNGPYCHKCGQRLTIGQQEAGDEGC